MNEEQVEYLRTRYTGIDDEVVRLADELRAVRTKLNSYKSMESIMFNTYDIRSRSERMNKAIQMLLHDKSSEAMDILKATFDSVMEEEQHGMVNTSLESEIVSNVIKVMLGDGVRALGLEMERDEEWLSVPNRRSTIKIRIETR